MPQKEPSPLLNKKIEELELKLADMDEGGEDLDDLEDEDEAPETPSMPTIQTPLASDLDVIPYTPPPQVLQTPTRTECPSVVPFHTRLSSPQISYAFLIYSHSHSLGPMSHFYPSIQFVCLLPPNPSIQPLMHHTQLYADFTPITIVTPRS